MGRLPPEAPATPSSPANRLDATGAVSDSAPADAALSGAEAPPAARAAGDSSITPKMSTETLFSLRNFVVASSWSLSPFAKGTAVLAPGKRWLCTIPSTLPASADLVSGMWQVLQVLDSAG